MTYREAEDYIGQVQRLGSVPGLDSVRELLRRLGNPQDKLAFIHIAGTNGKGSVLAFVSTILKAGGYKTGRYISPTILEYRERIQINGHMISKTDFCLYLERVKTAAADMAAAGQPHPTLFEIDTAMAFLFFSERCCDIVVLETGMGGTMDATNIIRNTIAAVITPIDLDHTDYLGRTLAAVADNKAGIIKTGCTVISAPQQDEAARVLAAKCEELACPLRQSHPEQARNIKYGLNRQYFTYGDYRDLEITLAGRYQIENAILAVEVIKLLAQSGYPVRETGLRKGLRETVWPGRFQILATRPLVIADGAHNPLGARRLAESIRFYFTNKRIIYIIGILRDKDCGQIIAAVKDCAEQMITVTTPGPRGLSGYELAGIVKQYHESVTCADSVEEAVELACLLAGKDGVVVSFGSLSYQGTLLKIFKADTRRIGAANGR